MKHLLISPSLLGNKPVLKLEGKFTWVVLLPVFLNSCFSEGSEKMHIKETFQRHEEAQDHWR